MDPLANWSLATCVVIFLVAWLVLHIIRRLVLHPLSSFPGPRLAALSPWYKSYYEVVKGGEWLHQVDKLHKVHGDIVRVGPNELHFNDYRAYNKIFSVSGQFTKDPNFYTCFGVNTSTFGLLDPEKARLSRELISTYFNRRAILRLEEVIQAKVEKLVQLLCLREKPSDMFYAFRCATMDIITTHCFQTSSQCLDSLDFKAPLLTDIQTAASLLWTLKSFPWILPIMRILPRCIGGRLLDQYYAFGKLQSFVKDKIQEVRQGTTPQDSKAQGMGAPSIYHDLLNRMPSLDNVRLMHEAMSLVQAGSDTVANTCIVGTFHILNNPAIHARLTRELRDAWPDRRTMPTWTKLERIPYLTAVIKESLRMSHGFVSSIPRVVGPYGAEISGHEVPPHTIVSISVVAAHNNPDLFPQPHQFCPERWLDSRDLSQHLLAFSKGPRMCLGINMAWAELYCIFGTVFRKLDMTLVDTSFEDFADFHDYFIPVHVGRHLHIRASHSEA